MSVEVRNEQVIFVCHVLIPFYFILFCFGFSCLFMLFICFHEVLEIEPRAFCTLGKHFATEIYFLNH